MKLIDLVHHNPGEPEFQTPYNDPAFLAGEAFTGQVLKHVNACVALREFPGSADERTWLEAAQAVRDREIAAAAEAGVGVYYHIDLFVLPRRVVAARRSDLCDDQGRIAIDRPLTLPLHRELFAGLFERFPGIRGLVVRVGETYLFDTPHHAGNTAVPLGDACVSREEQIRQFIRLLCFLREEICERHGRELLYRTWDYYGDRFHADPGFYRAVTDAVPQHTRLTFSIKHTAGDFFRGCRPNPCLGTGNHRQIVEVQCAREYEGKGAYPNYIARGVIEGFPEVPQAAGLSDWVRTPQFSGVFTWSRGGGWFGPYVKDAFWPDLNARVLTSWTRDPGRPESEHFIQIGESVYGMDAASVAALRQVCHMSEEAVWLGRSVPAFARLRDFQDADSGLLWMRDDRIGGLDQLREMFRLLEEAGKLDEAVVEKWRAAELFEQMREPASCIRATAETSTAIRTSVEYGARLFHLVAVGWEVMVRRWRGESVDESEEQRCLAALMRYRSLATETPACASLFEPHYWNWPGETPAQGFAASVWEGARQVFGSAV